MALGSRNMPDELCETGGMREKTLAAAAGGK